MDPWANPAPAPPKTSHTPWWNPVHAVSSGFHALNPVGGLWNLASGITKSFVHPVYGIGEAVGQLGTGLAMKGLGGITGSTSLQDRGNAALQSAGGTAWDVLQKGVIGGAAGLGQGFANLGSDIATPLGFGGQYDKLAAAPFHALANFAGQGGLGDETYHQLADYTPSTAQARGRKEGYVGAYLGDMLLAAGAAGGLAKYAGKIGDFQAGLSTGGAAAEITPTADTGAIADAVTAEAPPPKPGESGYQGPGQTAYKVQAAAKTAAEALNWMPRGRKALDSAGSFIGLKTGDLVKAIHERVYPATGTEGVPAEGAPSNPVVDQQVAAYNQEHGLPAPSHVDPTQELNPELGARRATWYQNAESTPTEPATAAAYHSLAQDVKAQYRYLTEKLGVKVIADNGDIGAGRTYETPGHMVQDIVDNKTLHVTPTEANSAHPVEAMNEVAGKDATGKPMTVNDMFRAVHDYFGHSRAGNDVGPNGEDIAWQLHQQMFRPESIPALATETAGQNGYLNFSQSNQALKAAGQPAEFGPQKAALMPQELRGPSPAEVAAARATLHPVDGAAEAMAANATAEADVAQRQAERGTTADRRVKVPTNTAGESGNAPVGEENKTFIDKAVAAARAKFGPTFIEDRQGNRLDMPAPAWAVRIAEALPDSVNRALAHLNTPMSFFRMRAIANDMSHYVEIAQNDQRSSAMHIAAENAVTDLIDTGRVLDLHFTRDQLSHMVGEEVSYRLDGGAMLAEYARDTATAAPPEIIQQMMAAAKRNYVGISDNIWNAMSDEQHAAVDKALNDIQEQYKIGSQQRLETMLASRYGAQGLERALAMADQVLMTSDQVRLYRRSMDDFRRAAVLRERDVTEQKKLQADTTKAVLFAEKADQATVDAQAKLGVNEATVQSLHDPIPKGVVNAEDTAARILEDTVNNQGATYDIGKGVPRAADGFVVGLHQQFEIPLDEFVRTGGAKLLGAIRSPVGFDGQVYDPSALWSGPDAVLGTWVHTGADGVPVVTVDVGVASNAGVPLSELQARSLGEAYNQEAIYNPATGADIVLSKDPQTQNLNALYVRDMLDPKSQLSRVARELTRTVTDGNLNITAEEAHAALQNLMQMDRSLMDMSQQYKPGDIFKRWSITGGTKPANVTQFFRQLVAHMPVDPSLVIEGQLQSPAEMVATLAERYGMSPADPRSIPLIENTIRQIAEQLSRASGKPVTPDDALLLLRSAADGYVGLQDWGRLLAHHDLAQSDLNAVEAAVTAGGVVDAATFQPFRDYWQEEGGPPSNYTKLETRWQRLIRSGNFDRVRSEMTSYISRERNTVLGLRNTSLPAESSLARTSVEGLVDQMAGDVKGITIGTGDRTGSLLTKLYKTADLSTLLEGQAHLLRAVLPPDVLRQVRDTYAHLGETSGGELTALGKAAETRFVTDLQRFIQDTVRGGNVDPAHAAMFTRVASLLEDGYSKFLNSPEGRAVPHDISAFWDRLYNPGIIHPDALHDPLSAQYVRPGPGVNVKQFSWETSAEFSQRARQYGEARGTTPGLEREVAQAKARAVRANAAADEMQQAILHISRDAQGRMLPAECQPGSGQCPGEARHHDARQDRRRYGGQPVSRAAPAAVA